MTQLIDSQSRPAWHEPHADIRTDAYVLLAALLNDTPSGDLIDIIQHLRWSANLPERTQEALARINRACSTCPVDSIAEEFHRLFVGLGSGEMIPYGSWYREKMIQSAPLAALRSDLGRLGIVRKSDTFESEDHAAALCEIMALLSNPENEIPESEQAAFFESHIASWMPEFFKELQAVKNAEFYRTVGEFGSCFLEGESEYLQEVRIS
ncbi:MAG: molecular chaperone TorD family protein [Desulfobulbaceae bacterium]|nr:molecular chaperone TorD family protein [Desulfobulbaceae bacterium]